MRAMINRVKNEDLFAAREIAFGPITGEDDHLVSQVRPRIICLFVRRRWSLNQSGSLEPAFDGLDRRYRSKQAVTHQFLANRARSDMTDRALRKPLADPDYYLDRRSWVSVGRVMRGFRATIQRRPPLLLKPLLPFAEPRAGTGDASQNFSGGSFLVKELEGKTTITNFFRIFLIHQPTLKAVMNEAKTQ